MSIAERAATFAVGKNDNRILRDLRVDSEILQRLVDAFAVMLKDDAFKVHSFIEGHGITDIPGFTGKVGSFIKSRPTNWISADHGRLLKNFRA